MKILIIGLPRSGTNSIIMGISKSLNLYRYFEPFNFFSYNKNIYLNNNYFLKENCILKNMASHKPKEKSNLYNFYDEFIMKFDNIIILSRKNKMDLLESFCYAMKTDEWHYKWRKNIKLNLLEYFNYVRNESILIENISKRYKIDITWYEDLYSGDKEKVKKILKKWDINGLEYDLFKKHIDPINRYRQLDDIKFRLL